jgi:hypothetical protein
MSTSDCKMGGYAASGPQTVRVVALSSARLQLCKIDASLEVDIFIQLCSRTAAPTFGGLYGPLAYSGSRRRALSFCRERSNFRCLPPKMAGYRVVAKGENMNLIRLHPICSYWSD